MKAAMLLLGGSERARHQRVTRPPRRTHASCGRGWLQQRASPRPAPLGRRPRRASCHAVRRRRRHVARVPARVAVV